MPCTAPAHAFNQRVLDETLQNTVQRLNHRMLIIRVNLTNRHIINVDIDELSFPFVA